MRLADRVLSGQRWPIASDLHGELSSWLEEYIAKNSASIVPIEATDCAAFFLNQRNGETASVDWFPNIAPPFEKFFIEYSYDGGRYGALFVLERLEDVPSNTWRLVGGHAPSELRWFYRIAAFGATDDGRLVGVPATASVCADVSGKIISFGGKFFLGSKLAQEAPGYEGYFLEEVGSIVSPCLFALSMMHCKNVVISDVARPPKLAKKQLKKHGVPALTYKTLNIEPMKRAIGDARSAAGGVGLARAMHICRGHFKTFSEDKPLFGRLAGTYWWPQAVRGSPEVGRVIKDYSVDSPSESAK